MDLFKRRLKHAWEYTVQGAIWRVHPAVNGKLIGEERDLGKKRTSFFCVDQRTGKVLWERVTVAEPWWVGIALVDKDVLLVHGYATPDMPGQRGLTAIDTTTGSILWSNAGWELANSTANGYMVLATASDKTVELEIDRRTGSPNTRKPNQDLPWDLNASSRVKDLADTHFPLPFDPEKLDDATVLRTAAQRYISPEKSGVTEYLALHDHVVITTFELTESDRKGNHQTRVAVRILDARRGKEMFSEIVAADASGQIPDTFFSQHGFVYFVKERKVLCAVRLWS